MLKPILRWGVIAGLLAVPTILPFIVSATMFFPYITGKNFTFRIIIELVFAAWVLLALMDAHYRPRFSWVLAAFALFIVVVGIADLQGANPFKSFWSNFERMEGYLALLHLFMYFLVASTVLNTTRLWNAFWYSSLTASVAIAFLGLRPILASLPELSYQRIDATFGNPIYLAIYSMFHIFVALILMARWRGTVWHQVILGAVALLHLVTLIFTYTRGTVLGFLGGAVLTTLIIALFERERRALRYVAIGALALLVLVVGLGYGLRTTELAKENPLLSRFTQISLSEGTVNARFMNWGMAWEGVKERPLLGYGQDNYEYVFSKHYDPNMYAQEPWFDRTHNIIFDWLIAAGFLGLIAYLLIPTALMAHLWGFSGEARSHSLRSLLRFEGVRELFHRRDHAFTVTERALVTGLIAAYFFHNLFVFDNIVSYILYVSVLAYLAWRLTSDKPPLFEKVVVPKETIMPVALPVVLVVTFAVVYFVNVPGIKTAQTLIQALIAQGGPPQALSYYREALAYDQLGRQEVREQLVQAATGLLRAQEVDAQVRQEFAQLAESEMERELARNSDSARLQLFVATLYMNLGQYDKAYTALERAVELTPQKQSALYQLGELQLIRGETEKGVETFKRAYELAPVNNDARKLYAYALIQAGKDKEAVDLLIEGFGTAAVDDTRLLRAWTSAKRFDIVAQVLEERIEKNPDDVQQIVSLAATYKELGDIERAVRLLNDVSTKHPEYKAQMDTFIADLRTPPGAKKPAAP